MAGLGHVAVGLVAGRYLSRRRPELSLLATTAVFSGLSLLPDLDVVSFALGIPYEAEWGHRGASHSLAIAGLVAAASATLPIAGRLGRGHVALLVAIVVASHGLLDSLTDGGRGIALGWPLTHERFFAPWRPIPVSPIGGGLFSLRGARVVATELVMFAPLLVWALWPRARPTDVS